MAIRPSCLNVERAMIFFISCSCMATRAAIKMVVMLVSIIINCIVFEAAMILLNR